MAASTRRGCKPWRCKSDRKRRRSGPVGRARRERGDRRQGAGAAARRAVPPAQGLQVLRGQDRRHQLQGREAAAAVRAGARQDPAAAHLGHVRDAPAQAAHGHHAGARHRAAAVRDRLTSARCGARPGWPPPPADAKRTVMEVILREHVENLGQRGDVVKVANGYARNYLLPRKLALTVTEGNRKQIDRERKVADMREAEERQGAEAIAARLAVARDRDRAPRRRNRGALRLGHERRYRGEPRGQGRSRSSAARSSSPSRSSSSGSSRCRSGCTATSPRT